MDLTALTAAVADALRPLLPARDERGATATEYGLLITGIATMIVLVVFLFGENVLSLFTDTCDEYQAARGEPSC